MRRNLIHRALSKSVNNIQQMPHKIEDIIAIFNDTFFSTYNTKLIKGEDEPIYLPADESHSYHRIIFAHGYYASAMHEIAHWCVAGAKRRLLEDFGYWYVPDGRTAEQQHEFEKVEIKPQAIEWALCAAAGKSFHVSADNLEGATPDTQTFKMNVFKQVQCYLSEGFPERVNTLMTALSTFYNQPLPTDIEHFLAVSPMEEKVYG